MIYTVFFDTDTEEVEEHTELPQDFETYNEALAYAQEIVLEGRAKTFVIEEA